MTTWVVTAVQSDGARIEKIFRHLTRWEHFLVRWGLRRKPESPIISIKRCEPCYIEASPEALCELAGLDMIKFNANGDVSPAPWNCMTTIKVT